MRNVLFTLLFAGVLLLLLSALVVSAPQDRAEPIPAVPVNAVLLPQPPQACEAGSLAAARPLISHPLWLYAALAVVCLLAALHNRDANGRVLKTKKYKNSVYQAFRPQVAVG